MTCVTSAETSRLLHGTEAAAAALTLHQSPLRFLLVEAACGFRTALGVPFLRGLGSLQEHPALGLSQPTPEQAPTAQEGLSGPLRLPTTSPSLNIAFSFLLFKSFDIFQSKIFLSVNLGRGAIFPSAECCFSFGRWAVLCPLAPKVLSQQHPGSSALQYPGSSAFSTQGPKSP